MDAPRWQARLQGMKIYAKVDGLLEVGGHTVIRHWKGGRRNTLKRTRPLLGYASLAQARVHGGHRGPMQPTALFTAIGLGRSLEGRLLWRDIDLTLQAGDRLGLVAPSGQGKTLLLRNLALLDPLQRGSLRLQGRPPASWGLPAWRARVAYLSQRPVAHAGTVEENLRSVWGYASQRRRGGWQPRRICGWLERLGRRPAFLGYPAERLSGGELQLLSLLRALQLDPVVLLLDEPCASLDAATTLALEALLREWLAEDGRACVLTSHDPRQIGRFTTARLQLNAI